MDVLSTISSIIVGLTVDVIIFMFCLIILTSVLHYWKEVEVEREDKHSKRIFWLSFVIIATIMVTISYSIKTPGERLCKFLISIMS